MTTKPRGSLANLAVIKAPLQEPQEVVQYKKPQKEPAEKLVGNILRLNPAAWRTLKILTLDLSEQRGRVMRSTELIREALNDYFVKNGKPPVA